MTQILPSLSPSCTWTISVWFGCICWSDSCGKLQKWFCFVTTVHTSVGSSRMIPKAFCFKQVSGGIGSTSTSLCYRWNQNSGAGCQCWEFYILRFLTVASICQNVEQWLRLCRVKSASCVWSFNLSHSKCSNIQPYQTKHNGIHSNISRQLVSVLTSRTGAARCSCSPESRSSSGEEMLGCCELEGWKDGL